MYIGVCVAGRVCLCVCGGAGVGGGVTSCHTTGKSARPSHICQHGEGGMPEGHRVRGHGGPLQSAQITYPVESITWLLSLFQTLTICPTVWWTTSRWVTLHVCPLKEL